MIESEIITQNSMCYNIVLNEPWDAQATIYET